MIKYLIAIAAGMVLVASASAQGYHWVRPHYDHNGVFYNGHIQTNPDGNPYNNFSYPGSSYPYHW
jgi:hypothetical protein